MVIQVEGCDSIGCDAESVHVISHQSYKLAVELKPDQSQAWMNMGGIQHIKVGTL